MKFMLPLTVLEFFHRKVYVFGFDIKVKKKEKISGIITIKYHTLPETPYGKMTKT